VFCLGALAHCLFTLYLLLQHVLTSTFPSPLCVFSQPFKVSELPDNAMTLLLLSGVACRCCSRCCRLRNALILVCSAHMAYSSQSIMRLPQRLALGKLQGECVYVISCVVAFIVLDSSTVLLAPSRSAAALGHSSTLPCGSW